MARAILGAVLIAALASTTGAVGTSVPAAAKNNNNTGAISGLPGMIAECWRLLAPGGVMVHVDVPIQPGYIGLADQALNHWQVRHNNEPSWQVWADADIPRYLRDAGFVQDDSFAGTEGEGPAGTWYVYGGRKPADAA